ncbi:MAG: hypothetical protein ACI4UU_05720 [Clostridia bacterium]
MKKVKIAIITLICLVIILIGTIFIIKLQSISEISDYIVFKTANYESIEDVVFYSKDLNLDDELKDNLTIIANQLKVKYPGKSILYLRNLGSASLFDAKELYRCMQIINGQKLDDTDMNVLIKEDGSVEIQFLIRCAWKSGSDIDNVQITQEQAEKIVIDYLYKNPDDYKVLRSGFNFTFNSATHEMSKVNTETCTVELYKYNSKTAWKMQFSTGDSYIIIDANTGKILDTYFFCGIYVD